MMTEAWRERPPEPGRVRPYEFPRVSRKRLDNGLTVLHARYGDLPLVAIRVVLRAGAASESWDTAGLARLVASSLDTGTERYDGPGLAWELERLGIELETEAGWDAIALEATIPSARLDPAVALLAEVARRATFADAEVERLRSEQLGQILLRRTEPRALADDAIPRFVFAAGTRYARPLIGTAESVEPLTPQALRAFHAGVFAPDGCAVVLAGNLDADTAWRTAEHHFGDWSGSAKPLPEPDVRPGPDAGKVHIVARPQAVQSEIRVGHPGVPRAHPDYVPLLVMNAILGGMFTSRLNLNLRERNGFTYGVRSGFGFRRVGGTFLTATAVATDVTARAVAEILAELERMHGGGATDDEAAAARDYLAGVMPLQLQTAGAVADALTELFIHDLPDDWHRRHREALTGVSADDTARVARDHLDPAGATIVVVGDPEPIGDRLESAGRGPATLHEPA